MAALFILEFSSGYIFSLKDLKIFHRITQIPLINLFQHRTSEKSEIMYINYSTPLVLHKNWSRGYWDKRDVKSSILIQWKAINKLQRRNTKNTQCAMLVINSRGQFGGRRKKATFTRNRAKWMSWNISRENIERKMKTEEFWKGFKDGISFFF